MSRASAASALRERNETAALDLSGRGSMSVKSVRLVTPDLRRTPARPDRWVPVASLALRLARPGHVKPAGDGRGNIPGTARAPSGLEETGESAGRGVTAGVTTP